MLCYYRNQITIVKTEWRSSSNSYWFQNFQKSKFFYQKSAPGCGFKNWRSGTYRWHCCTIYRKILIFEHQRTISTRRIEIQRSIIHASTELALPEVKIKYTIFFRSFDIMLSIQVLPPSFLAMVSDVHAWQSTSKFLNNRDDILV